jgi:hypothetical protein
LADCNLIASPPELQFGQRVLHGDLKYLHYDMVYMHKLSPKIDEAKEFPIRLNVKKIL